MSVSEFRARFARAVGKLAGKLTRQPSAAEVADALNMSVRNLHRWCLRVESMTPAKAIREAAGGRTNETAESAPTTSPTYAVVAPS